MSGENLHLIHVDIHVQGFLIIKASRAVCLGMCIYGSFLVNNHEQYFNPIHTK